MNIRLLAGFFLIKLINNNIACTVESREVKLSLFGP